MAEKRPRGKPSPRWQVLPLRRIEGEVGYTCSDERCGEHGKFVTPVTRDGSTEGRAIRDRDRCPTCLATVVPHVEVRGSVPEGGEDG